MVDLSRMKAIAVAFWDGPEGTEANVGWVRDVYAATRPFSSGEVYVNSLDLDEADRVREAYGPNWGRLTAIKAKYDPENFFRVNHNIPPLPVRAPRPRRPDRPVAIREAARPRA